MSLTQEALSKFSIIDKYFVHWGDMDAAQHVNNLVYLRWVESARIAYFDKLGIDISFKGKVGPILGWQDCKYIFPITYPDVAIVGIRVQKILDDRLIMECHIYSQQHDRLSAITSQSIIPYHYATLSKVPIPQNWLDAIQKIEN